MWTHSERLKKHIEFQEESIKSLQTSLNEVSPSGKRKATEPADGAIDKKLKTEESQWDGARVAWSAKDVSLSEPYRRKMHLEFIQGNSRGAGGIRVRDPVSEVAEFELSWDAIGEYMVFVRLRCLAVFVGSSNSKLPNMSSNRLS